MCLNVYNSVFQKTEVVIKNNNDIYVYLGWIWQFNKANICIYILNSDIKTISAREKFENSDFTKILNNQI